ncbi:MAG TPA: Stk1 family PASTA domain-containing Ser/Thr kinase [Pseudonocardiaceae bacterium]|jgi:serine/threonine-protein kinase|nr:Stk1 family PASTA domain-containing Ser/Thr kinase [Pseudonocardiaceae bacterium]
MSTPRLLSNRYELGDTLGYGGMSEVHKGRDVRLGRDVAVKVLRADLARDPQFQERFRREAQNAAALNHPAIVAVYDTGETRTDFGPLPYIVMEFVDGRTLRDIVKTEGPLPGKRAMEVMADVSAALDFSHRHGIVHRDVKPANVMITKTGAVKVMDFGIARAVADGQAAVTQTAAVIGTAQYLSPEQARGEAVDARSDVYASGCVLFELLTGEPPFTGDSPVAVAYQHVREDPKPPSALNPRVTPALDAIVLKAMAKGPANRYQSAAEMRGDLVRVLSGQRPAAPAVMTDSDRTSMMGAGARTEVMGGGRHRPEALEDDYDDYDDYGGGFDPDEEARRKRKRNWIIAAVVAVVVLIALAIFLIPKLAGNNSHNGQSQVPDLTGKPQAQAISTLTGLNLKPNTKQVICPAANGSNTGSTSSNSPFPCTNASQVGTVLGTDPGSGTYLDPGSTVNVYVGVAPNNPTVPDLTNKSPQDAQTALQAVGLTLGPTTNQPTANSAQVGKVINQTVTAGTQVTPGSAVGITVGTAEPTHTLPDLAGDTQAQATSTLQGLNLRVATTTVQSAQPKGTVINTNPGAGATVAEQTTVTLNISDGSQAGFSMPNIINSTQNEARQILKGMGWTGSFNVTQVPTEDPTQNGLIADSNPEPGTQVQDGQTININVYQFSIGGGGSGGGTTTSCTPSIVNPNCGG